MADEKLGSALLWRLSIVLLLLAVGGEARSGHITLVIATTTEVQGRHVKSRVVVTNNGDELASNMGIRVELHGQRYASVPLAVLDVGRSHDARFTLPLLDMKPGRHAMAIFVDYSDAAGYRFSAPSYANLILGADNPPRLEAALGDVKLDGEAILEMRLKNLDSTPHQAHLKLVLPAEIGSPQSETTIVTATPGEQLLRFPLRNNGVLPGRSYPVFVAIDYDEEGRHSSLYVSGTITTASARSFLKTHREFLIVAVVVLFLLLLGLQPCRYTKNKAQQ